MNTLQRPRDSEMFLLFIFSWPNYLCQGGYVFAGVCLFVSKITPKVINRFQLKFQEMLIMGLSCLNFGDVLDYHLDPGMF